MNKITLMGVPLDSIHPKDVLAVHHREDLKEFEIQTVFPRVGPDPSGKITLFDSTKEDPIVKAFWEAFQIPEVAAFAYTDTESYFRGTGDFPLRDHGDDEAEVGVNIQVRGNVKWKLLIPENITITHLEVSPYKDGKRVFKTLDCRMKGDHLHIDSKLEVGVEEKESEYISIGLTFYVTDIKSQGYETFNCKFERRGHYYFRHYYILTLPSWGFRFRMYEDIKVGPEWYNIQHWFWEGDHHYRRDPVAYPINPRAEDPSSPIKPGKEGNPWIITSAYEFLSIKHRPKDYYILESNIYLDILPFSVDQGWVPFNFEGDLDLNGYTIKNVNMRYVKKPSGLFAINRGHIHGGHIEGEFITEGVFGGVAAVNFGDIENMTSRVIVKGDNVCGGIAGINYGRIRGCLSSGLITPLKGDGHSSKFVAGAIAGEAQSGSYTVNNHPQIEGLQEVAIIHKNANIR